MRMWIEEDDEGDFTCEVNGVVYRHRIYRKLCENLKCRYPELLRFEIQKDNADGVAEHYKVYQPNIVMNLKRMSKDHTKRKENHRVKYKKEAMEKNKERWGV